MDEMFSPIDNKLTEIIVENDRWFPFFSDQFREHARIKKDDDGYHEELYIYLELTFGIVFWDCPEANKCSVRFSSTEAAFKWKVLYG